MFDQSYAVDLGGFEVRALSLERLLVVKRKLGRPKDLLMALQIEPRSTRCERSVRARRRSLRCQRPRYVISQLMAGRSWPVLLISPLFGSHVEPLT